MMSVKKEAVVLTVLVTLAAGVYGLFKIENPVARVLTAQCGLDIPKRMG